MGALCRDGLLRYSTVIRLSSIDPLLLLYLAPTDLCLFQTVLEDPMSEETQGQNIVKEAKRAGIQCFIWSTLPSSYEISGGKFMTRLYEGTVGTEECQPRRQN